MQFPKEWNCYRSMKERVRKGKATISPEFQTFEGFLRHLGQKPTAEATVDRIDPKDPEYAPGKVRWASKQQQANNRSSTIFLTLGDERLPLTEWARRTSQSPDTLRKRLKAGWKDQEVITGERHSRNESKAEPGNIVDKRLRELLRKGKIPRTELGPFGRYRAALDLYQIIAARVQESDPYDDSPPYAEAIRDAVRTLGELRQILRATEKGRRFMRCLSMHGPRAPFAFNEE